MKNLFRLLMLLCVSIFTLSCGDGDATSPQDPGNSDNNVISTPAGDFQISSVILEDYGLWEDTDNTFNLDFTFLGEGLTYNSSSEQYLGSGMAAYFEMVGPSEGYLPDGDYSYDDDWPAGAYTYTDSSELIDITDAANEEYTVIHNPTSTVTIERDGSFYTFSYSSGSYSIQYSGVPVFVDRTSRSMATKK